jgi:diadenosine tetraphosphate (Ap4A) HIT family hydrolase
MTEIKVSTLTDDQIRCFFHRVRTHHLVAYLRRQTDADRARILGLLSDVSADFMRQRLQDAARSASQAGHAARAERTLADVVADSHNPAGSSCIFCEILAGDAPGSFVYRDAEVAALMDVYPLTPGHMLVIPVQHAASIAEVSPPVAGLMFQQAQRLGRALMRSDLGCDGYNFFLANGGAAGQDVFHAHLHVIPRYHGDGFDFVLPPNYPQEADRIDLDRQAAQLVRTLRAV